jgi:hypothetical protein
MALRVLRFHFARETRPNAFSRTTHTGKVKNTIFARTFTEYRVVPCKSLTSDIGAQKIVRRMVQSLFVISFDCEHQTN